MLKKIMFLVLVMTISQTVAMSKQKPFTQQQLSTATKKLFDELRKVVFRSSGTAVNLQPTLQAIKDGADINAIDNGFTPLGLAVSQNDYEVAMELLKNKNIDVNIIEKISDYSGAYGPLIFSVLHRRFEDNSAELFLKQMLLTKNVDLSLKNTLGERPLEHAFNLVYQLQDVGNLQEKAQKQIVLLKMLITFSSPTDVKKLKNITVLKNIYWDAALGDWQKKQKLFNLYEDLKYKDLKNFIDIFAHEPNAVITPEALHYVIDLQRINLMPYFYQQLNTYDWFTRLEKSYPVFKVCGDLIPNAKISQETAKAFLKNTKRTDDHNLALIREAYGYAKHMILRRSHVIYCGIWKQLRTYQKVSKMLVVLLLL